MSKLTKILSTGLLMTIALSARAECGPHSDLDVVAWSYKAMLATYNYNFVNHKQSFKEAQNFYTKGAWKKYMSEVTKSGRLKKVINKKLVSSVGTDNSPLIIKKDQNTWQVQLPLILHLQSQKADKVKTKLVTLTMKKGDDNCLKISKVS